MFGNSLTHPDETYNTKTPKDLLEANKDIQTYTYWRKYLYWRLYYDILCFIVCLAIAGVYIATNSPEKYFILYSYWANSVLIIAYGVAIYHDRLCIRACAINTLAIDNDFITRFAIVEYFKDGLITVGFMQLTVSCVAFWGFIGFSSTFQIVTILDHSLILILSFVSILTSRHNSSYWILLIALIYNSIYYTSNICVFYLAGYWVYWPEEHPWGWIALITAILLSQIVVFYLLRYLEILKAYIWRRWDLEVLTIKKWDLPKPQKDTLFSYFILISLLIVSSVFTTLCIVTFIGDKLIFIPYIGLEGITLVSSILSTYFSYSYIIYNDDKKDFIFSVDYLIIVIPLKVLLTFIIYAFITERKYLEFYVMTNIFSLLIVITFVIFLNKAYNRE